MDKSISKILLFFLVFLAPLSGCNSTKVSENAAALDVSFEWTKASICSSVSPEIHILNIPKDVKYLRIKVVDLDMPTYDHGGGEVLFEGSATVGEGALKSYDGPCPLFGVEHSYEITVQALDADKKVVLGHGKAIRKYKNEG